MRNFTSLLLLLLIFTYTSYSQYPPGVRGYYKLNGNGADSSGLGNHGTIVGTVIPTDDRFNNPTGAMFFDGTSGHIDMGNPPALQITDSLTIAAWIQPMQSPNWSGIASKWTADGYYLGINPATNRLRFNLGNGNILEGSIVSYGNWMHVAATFDGTTMRIYENGVMADSLVASQPASATNASFFIGAQYDLPTNKFLGSIDEVFVYARALSHAEILQLMNPCAAPSLSVTSTNAPCHGGFGTATVNATGGTAPYTYSWSNGETTQTAVSLPIGTHTVTVTDDSLCSSFATVTILQPAVLGSTISSTPTNFTTPNCNGTVTVTPFGGTPPYTVVWNSGTTSNLCEGWYAVTITDANNCVKTDSVYVNFVTGIEELNAAGISVYPNPVNNVITITSLKEIGEVKIYDNAGKLILTETTQQKNFNFNISELNNGIYFAEINNKSGQRIMKRLVIIK